MIKIEILKDLIKTILYTGYIEGEKPLSVMFVGKVGSGKSEIINQFKLNDNIAYFSDLTYMGLIKLLSDNPNIKHIAIPDFLKITMKKKSTMDNVVSAFNSLMEEGLEKISMMGVEKDFKGKQCGIITATTKASFSQHENIWKSMGFLSRMLIISFDYKDETINEIFEYIFNSEYLKDSKKEKIALPFKDYEVKITNKLAKALKEDKTNFRRQKQLQVLAKARALMNGRFEVNEQDVKEINDFKKFLNLNYTKI